MNFDQFSLAPQILKGIKTAGYVTPPPIQQQAIPVTLLGQDLLGLAQTGTGKTASFLLPILQRLVTRPTQRRVRALIIAPTRELAEQIRQAAVALGRETGVRSVSIYGGVSKIPQLQALRRGAEIVIACPGRLLDHLNEGDIDLSSVEVLVLDEADTLCDMGFLPDVRRILNYLPEKRQNLFYSATMPDEIRKLATGILNSPATVQVDPIAPANTVSHALYPVPENLKKPLLLAMLAQTPTGRALIFTRTKHRARTLALNLAKEKYRVSAIQGNLSQNRRQEAMNGFRDGKYDILVATDIAAHGIDVPEISHVINFDMPDTVDAYIHRIGRTGRAHETGEAFTLAVPDDQAMVHGVERVLGTTIERRRLTGFDYAGFDPETQFPQRRPAPPREPEGHKQPARRSYIPRGGNSVSRNSKAGPARRPASSAAKPRLGNSPSSIPGAARPASGGPRRRGTGTQK